MADICEVGICHAFLELPPIAGLRRATSSDMRLQRIRISPGLSGMSTREGFAR
jgi:hypothetical protein